MKRLTYVTGIVMLIGAVVFNLWTYRMETGAAIDPNDNTFQFALVDRTNQILDFAQQKCTGIFRPFCTLSFMADHWVPNWAEGYNLPHYYSHIPQILIVAGWRLFTVAFSSVSLFTYYHWVIYLLLCLFPVSVFISLRIIRMPYLTAGFGAIIATHLSTDGLYGLDPASYLWRGYGLSSQLFAAVWLPLALASAYRHFILQKNNATIRDIVPPALFLAATTAGHLGLGIIAFISVAVIWISPYIQAFLEQSWEKSMTKEIVKTGKKLGILFGLVGLLLGYWIIPVLIHDNYHNISVWDGIWKFNSFGFREVLKNFFDGNLFDFGRIPILTLLVIVGLFAALPSAYFPFALLFVVWILMYFGRTTWGGLFNLIPGMSEFHLSRFIVGVHISGLFLIPIAFNYLAALTERMSKMSVLMRSVVTPLTLSVLIIVAVYPQTIRYATHNDFLIARANTAARQENTEITALFTALNTQLKKKPGRVYAGRGGSWGKSFRIAETPMYMHLSTYGIPVILWLPETWSPNSDTEQYFSENNPDHYTLYNVRFVATPAILPNDQIQPFWKLVEAGNTWKLYEVETEGYISPGFRTAVVSTDKRDYRNVVRLWMHGAYPTANLYPELTFDTNYPKQTGLPNFRMIDEVTYKVPASTRDESMRGGPDGSTHNLFAEVPHYVLPSSESASLTINSQSSVSDMEFSADVTVPEGCIACIVVLRQSFHPSWQATVDGKHVKPFAVFPFFTAIQLNEQGVHRVVFTYSPSPLKQVLLATGIISLIIILAVAGKKIKQPGT